MSAGIIRIAAAWVLLGAVLKSGMRDNPHLLLLAASELPSDLVYWVGLTIESFVAVLALLVPKTGWRPLVGLLLMFAAILAPEVAAGSTDCGCFGDVSSHPFVVFAIDLLLAIGVVWTCPWTIDQRSRPLAPWIAMLVSAAVVTHSAMTDRLCPEAGDFLVLDVESWSGQLVEETPLRCWLDSPDDGVWIVMRADCPTCKDCLAELTREEGGGPRLRVLEIPSSRMGHSMAVSENVVELPSDVKWIASVPMVFRISGGRVRPDTTSPACE